ncbi:hypothetical protein [Roseovarius sp. 2305UL8-3]|uniref:hypothetical protein n=1 Tax=Roseovarius conchicola TaxID=3121636 RepID=UPI003529170C
MSSGLSSLFLAILIGWVAWGGAALVVAAPLSILIGGAVGALVILLLRDTLVVNGAMALLEPIGVILPLLVLRQVAIALDWPMPTFNSLELFAFLVVYVGFLAASMGVFPVDPYRLGYAPWPVAIMVLILCLYGLLTGNWFVPLAAVAAQFLWVMGQGSSNWFDHMLHATLVPVVVVVLLLRLVG